MSLKKFFKSPAETSLNKASKINLQVSGSDVVKTLDEAREKSKFDRKIFAGVDISSSLANYVRYGLAEYHYETGIQRIYNEYPYDGTLTDKYKFLNESTTFDYHIWKDLYPKTTGYITLNEGASSTQRVEVKAGPNLNTVFNSSTNQTNNLSFDASEGVTVEFWAKPTGSSFSGGIFETVDTSGNYFVVYLNNPGGTGVQLIAAKSSSTGGTEAYSTFSTLTGYDAEWHHYALTFELNGSNNLVSTLYVDGEYTEQLTDSNTVSTTVDALSGNVGYAQTYYYKGAIDEFRYWKTKRTEKEIGLNWNTYVDGGSNVSGTISYPLSVYFKFNEGITGVTSFDETVLDYSGRLASASILNYLSTARSTGSAISEYSSEYYEEPDPIVYSIHPDVVNLETDKVRAGRVFDGSNNHSFFQLMPEWIRDQDTEDLKFISHIIGARFDEMYAQISSFEKVKRKDYHKELKIFPYYETLAQSEGFDSSGFLEGDFLAEIQEKTSLASLSSGSLAELKSTVYRNIYNNLLYIYKKKGTLSSIRNLLNCYGVDQNLIKFRTFSDNTTTTIENREFIDNFKDKTIDFYGVKNLVANKLSPTEASIFNFTSSDANNLSYVPSGFNAYTIETNAYFPVQQRSNNQFYIGYDTSGSIFGVHSADSSAPADTTFSGSDACGLAVYAVHGGRTEKQGKFVLSSSNGVFGAIETNTYDIFDGTNWNLAVVVEADGDARNLTSVTEPEYVARLIGYQVESGITVNSFNITSSISAASASAMVEENKRVFVGAERNNFTGTLLYRSYARIGNCKFYGDSLEEEEVFLHAKYKNSDGRLRPFENVNRKNRNSTIFAPQYLSRVFEWDFEQVDTPDGAGQFEVKDISSASLNFADAFGIYGSASANVYSGFGYNFPTDIVAYENEFVSKVRILSPEESTAANVINSEGETEITFKINEAPSKEASLIGKSMYDVVSQDVLRSFAGINDFNYLIGNPVNKYRLNYKDLEALRRIYFDSVENNPTLEKFTKYFRWFDTVVDAVINNLLPATTKLASDSPNIVESHVLERSKFPLKYPTLENKDPRPTAVIGSIVNTENIAVRLNLLDDRREGAQGSFNFASSSANTPNYVSVYEIGAEQPLSGAVTPVSIVNVQTVTSSDDSRREGSVAPKNFASSTVGNYNKGYEVVQAVGQKGAFNGRYLANESVPSVPDTSFVSGVLNYQIADRNKYKTVIRSTFNAPGSPETMGGGLDLAAREFSVYNNLNYRNLIPRDFLRDLLVIPSAFGGYQSGSTTTASYHKTARNGYTRKVYSGASIVDKKYFDNYYVQTQIPATDLGYAWIAESYQSADINRYQTSSYFAPNEQITFLTASIQGADISNGASNETIYGVDAFAPRLEADSIFLGDPYVPLNFWLLDPVSASDNRLGFPLTSPIDTYQLDGYGRTSLTDPSIGQQQLISTLNSRRNGPYGYASWRAYRKDSHPIVRAHREDNTISFVSVISTTNAFGNSIRSEVINNVTQTPINTTSPMFVQLQDTNFDFKTSYENEKLGFTNTRLQLHAADFETRVENKKTFFNKIADFGEELISKISVRSEIFPLKDNQFLQLTRARDNFDNTWWRNSRADRQLTNATNSFGFGVDGTTSRWSMDARANFVSGQQPVSASSLASGSGELQNHYTTMHVSFPPPSNPKHGPLYARRVMELSKSTGSPNASSDILSNYDNHIVSGGFINVGDALWEVGSQSGKNPFYNSYDDYADELRRRGKDHSIVPEFKISDHIDTYLSNGFNFSAQLASFLSLTGASGFSVNRYSSAEISEVLAGVKVENSLGVTKFGLKAKALLKLLPYEGFYPQQRTVQLAQELSSSLKNSFVVTGSEPSYATALNPFIAPGILFNTIKSGIAVDRFTLKINAIQRLGALQENLTGVDYGYANSVFQDLVNGHCFETGSALVTDPLGTGSPLEDYIDLPSDMNAGSNTEAFSDANLLPIAKLTGLDTDSAGDNEFERLPFEAILDPAPHISEWYHDEQVPGLRDSRVLGKNPPKINYTLMANNFFAETTNFFLKRGLTSFEGAAKDSFNFTVGSTYTMDLVMRNSDIRSVTDFSQQLQLQTPGSTLSSSFTVAGRLQTASFITEMYNKPEAFGPPHLYTLTSGSDSVGYASLAAHTPPYYNGFARARYSFTPTQQQHTLDEVVSSMTIEYFRLNEASQRVLLEDPNYTFNMTASVGHRTMMQISSSVEVDAVVEEKRTKFNEDGDIVDFESFDTPRKKLVIHTKYECPVLDFRNSDQTLPANGSNSAPKGMWHQYGSIPNYSDEGIFLEVLDTPLREQPTPSSTGSLARALGIKKEKKAIGRLATAREINEGLVVLPYYVDDTKDQPIRFFELSNSTVSKTLKKANKKSISSTDDQLVRQARLMKEYVFPPFLDWVTFPPPEVEIGILRGVQANVKKPVMYVFEFGRTLSQQDLADIWQGVLPEAGLTAVEQEAVIDLDTTFEALPPGSDVISANIQSLLGNSGIAFEGNIKDLDNIDFNDLKFFVFKVKKRAEFDYGKITQNTEDDGLLFDFKARGLETELPFFTEFGRKRLSYSYNYPYDFCSLVELAKVDTQYELSGKFVLGGTIEPATAAVDQTVTPTTEPAAPTARFVTEDE